MRALGFSSTYDICKELYPVEKIRAFDKTTGQVVWEMALDAGSTGTLMTYLHIGKQYLVVAIGGFDHPAEFIALSLP